MSVAWTAFLEHFGTTINAIIAAAAAVVIYALGQRGSRRLEREKREAEARAAHHKNEWERDGESARSLRDAATALLVASSDYKRGRERNMDVDEELALMRKLEEAHEQYSLLAPDALEQLSADLFNTTASVNHRDDETVARFLNARRNFAFATRRVLHELRPYPALPAETAERLKVLGLYTEGDLVDPERGVKPE